jgi:DNA gyrase/topoisomerase IV subunit A
MDKLIPRLYKEYGMYVNHSRAFPIDLDGLKPVERRVLLTAYQVARDKFIKSAKVDGAVIGSYHPHSSCYGTIVQLVNQGFLDGKGNFGNNIGVEPSPAAASRYTECRLAKKTYEIALKLVEYVDFVESELDPEPEFLPVMFPLCFLGKEYTQGIGFGFKTLIPCYDIKDLKSRLISLLKKDEKKPIIKPYTNCKILSPDKDLESLLTTGKGSVVFQGIHKIDNVHCKAIIKTFPPGKKFETILGKFEKELNNQDIGYNDESSGENGGTHIIFEVLKSRNRDDIFKSFVKKLTTALTSTVSFEIVVVDHNTRNVKGMSVDEMLLNTLSNYISVNMRMLKENETKVLYSIEEVKLLDRVKPSLKKYLGNKELGVDEIIEKIAEEIKEDKDKIKKLFQKYTITKLLTFKADHDELQQKLKSLKDNIKNINQFVIKQYEEL